MKKVGVITLFNITNYGGTLQAVALSMALKKTGLEPVYIRHQPPVDTFGNIKEYIAIRRKLYGSNIVRMAVWTAKAIQESISGYPERTKKVKKFDEFRESNLTMTDNCLTIDSLKPIGKLYDGYITGSDQVWNDTFMSNEEDFSYYLDFVEPSKPCFSYAASTGGKKSDDYIKRIVELTRKFRKITVREKDLEESMTAMGASDVKTVLDPTLLFNAEEWKRLERKPEGNIPSRYVLMYYLDKDSSDDPLVKAVSKDTGLPIVDLHPTHRKKKIPGIYLDRVSGPREFLYWFSHADYVVTDSFHACVFSILFRRRFVAIQRVGQESRIANLLKNVGLDNHIIQEPENRDVIFEEISEKYEYLERCKAESYEYLREIKTIIEEE